MTHTGPAIAVIEITDRDYLFSFARAAGGLQSPERRSANGEPGAIRPVETTDERRTPSSGKPAKMDWPRLLTAHRPGGDGSLPTYRGAFETDLDRIVFSAPWRRLADKMQVHGLAGNAHVRTRLTHSMETSRVGRALGALVGGELLSRRSEVRPEDLGSVVAAAAAAHDLGTPPFSHVGERVISDWFRESPLGRELLEPLDETARLEFETFEANAHGFRLLAKLEGWRQDGGLRLTAATLAAFSKYPWGIGARTSAGKYGYLAEDAASFAAVADACGLLPGNQPGAWARHPLAHLVEAADDICYSIVDLEDGVRMKCLAYREAEDLLMPLVRDFDGFPGNGSEKRRLEFLRSRAIDGLIHDAARAFVAHEDEIFTGSLATPLLKLAPSAGALQRIASVSREKLYHGDRRNETDLVAYHALTALLDGYGRAFLERERRRGERLSVRARAIVATIEDAETIPYERKAWLRCVLDHIASLTDEAAVAQAALFAG